MGKKRWTCLQETIERQKAGLSRCRGRNGREPGTTPRCLNQTTEGRMALLARMEDKRATGESRQDPPSPLLVSYAKASVFPT